MASDQPAPRQWFRLPSIIRPVSQTTEPRPPMARPAFRPMGPQPQPGQPPEPTPALTFGRGVPSVPSSPIQRTSVPSSPVQKTTPTSTMLSAATTTSSDTSPPKPQVSDTSASLISSPSPKPSPSPPKPSTSSMTTSPTKPVPTSPPRLVLTSPPKLETTFVAKTVMPRPSPKTSPRTLKPAVQSPPESPKTKPTASPPSPLILPPPQLNSKAEIEPKIPAETEQKRVLVQTTTEKPKSWFYGTGHHNDFDERHKHNSGHHGKHELSKRIFGEKEKGPRKPFSSDSDEAGMRVITIAGENKGAFMEVIKSPMKHNFDGNSRTLRPQIETKWHSFSSSSSSSEEGNTKKKDESKRGKAMHSAHMGAFMNSNVQGVNNSIVFNSSCSHHDPGVHLSLSRKPTGPGIHVQGKTNGHHS